MKRCHCCQERFGLIRHYHGRLQFCSAICIASYRAAARQAAEERVRDAKSRGWLALFGATASQPK
jgi:hypothetical protein